MCNLYICRLTYFRTSPTRLRVAAGSAGEGLVAAIPDVRAGCGRWEDRHRRACSGAGDSL